MPPLLPMPQQQQAAADRAPLLGHHHNNTPGGNDNDDAVGSGGVSSRLPTPGEIVAVLVRALVGTAICMLLAFLALFVALCVLLAKANVPAVHAACPGFWDFMLAAVFAPVAIPMLYCCLAWCAWVSWQAFSGGACLALAIACLHLSLSAAENGACVEALRATSPPLPWLLYAGFIKGALFAAGALSSILARAAVNGAPASASAAARWSFA